MTYAYINFFCVFFSRRTSFTMEFLCFVCSAPVYAFTQQAEIATIGSLHNNVTNALQVSRVHCASNLI